MLSNADNAMVILISADDETEGSSTDTMTGYFTTVKLLMINVGWVYLQQQIWMIT